MKSLRTGSGGVDNTQFLFVVFGLSFAAASAVVAIAGLCEGVSRDD